MHYYQFNIGDHASLTNHLNEIEDIAYRRMKDLYYLHESPLPDDIDEIARRIRMRTHTESIALVLREFFDLTDDGYRCPIIDEAIRKYHAKSDKARASAKARWGKNGNGNNKKDDKANGMRTHSEGNANHKPQSTKHKPIKYTENDLKIAQDLYLLILRINPNHKEPNYERWADDIRKINKLDNRTHAEIWETILWVSNHHFWQTVILSPDNLRKKWDKITVQRVARGKPNETSKPVDNSAPGRVRAANRRRAIARGEMPDPDPY